MSPSSRRRGQTSPIAALTALFVVCAAVSGYATVLDRSLPSTDRDVAPSTLDAAATELSDDAGVVDPRGVSSLSGVCPDGFACRVVVAADDERYVTGPEPPVGATRATTRASVRVAPGEVRVGTLRVAVWR